MLSHTFEGIPIGSDTPGSLALLHTTGLMAPSTAMLPGEEYTVKTPVSIGSVPADIILAGFRDCTEETLRYLVDVENLSETDPLVIGLYQHLSKKHDDLNVQTIFMKSSSEKECTTHTPLISNYKNQENDQFLKSTNSETQVQMDIDCERISLHAEEYTKTDHTCNRQNSCTTLPSSSSLDQTFNYENSQQTNFALLAQNNPEIERVTLELLSLLDGNAEELLSLENELIDFL